MTASDEIRAALAKMTPAEWTLSGRLTVRGGGVLSDGRTPPWVGVMNWRNGDADVAGIVTLRNRAPDLLAERDQLAAENARLREALERIADTDPDQGTAWFHDAANAALSSKETRNDA
jgi:hypothetical protein